MKLYLSIILFFYMPQSFSTQTSNETRVMADENNLVYICHQSLTKYIENQEYEAYEKKLKYCILLAKDYDKRADLLSQTLFLDLNTRDAWDNPQRQSKLVNYFNTIYIHNLDKHILKNQTSIALELSFEFTTYFSNSWIDTIPPKYLINIFKVMEEKGFVKIKMIKTFYQFNIIHRLFTTAQSLIDKYDHINFTQIPTIEPNPFFKNYLPGFMSIISPSFLTKNNFDLKSGSKVVAIVSLYCPYTLKAMDYISKNKIILERFNSDGIYLVPQIISDFDKIDSYNQENPRTQFVMTTQDKTWKPIKDLGKVFPKFYFLKEGKVKFTVTGFGKDFQNLMEKGFQTIE